MIIKKIIPVAVVVLTFVFSTVAVSSAGFLEDLKKKIPSDIPIKKNKRLSEGTVIDGLKEALSVSTKKAVKKTSKTNGYFKNPKIKIPLPPKIERVGVTLRKAGLDKQVDDFVLSMNRAAEKAAPKAAAIFVDAIKDMSFDDARGILNGGDRAATEYFQRTSGTKIADEFRPVVTSAMDSVGVTKKFKELMGLYNSF